MSSSIAAVDAGPIQRRLLSLTNELESANKTQKKKSLKTLVDVLRDDGSKYLATLDQNSRLLAESAAAAGTSSASINHSENVDWSTIIQLSLTCVTQMEKSKSRSPGPFIELWQSIQFLFESAERNGHFMNKHIIDTCMQEILTILHLDSGSASGGAVDKDPMKIQGSIAALSSIMECIFSYPPYAMDIKQEWYHDLFALFSNTLITLARLSSNDLQLPHANLLTLIKPHSHFPDSFLGLYHAPAAAVNLLVQMVLQYPYTTTASTSAASIAVRKFLSSHVFPFYLQLFTLRIPDNLITKLMNGLNTMLEQQVMSYLSLFRDFSYKFIYAMMQPGSWPKSATIKNELIRFGNLVMRVANQLPINNTLRIVEELDTGHPLYRLLYRELDTDQLFTLVGVPLDHADLLQLDHSTHAFLCFVAHVVYQVQLKPEPTRSSDDATAAAVQAGSAPPDIADSSTSRKRRKLDTDVSFSIQSLWEHFHTSLGLPSQRLVSWLKFLYVFLSNYPRFLQLPSRGTLLSSLILGLSRTSERSKAEAKTWSLACLSRIASSCHINGIQLTQPPSAAFLLTFPHQQRLELQKQYSELASNFSGVVDLLLRKHLFDERKVISRVALSLLTKLANYQLIAPNQLSYLQTVFTELPALKQTTLNVGSGRLSSQIIELKKETTMMSPQPKFTPSRLSTAAAVAVKLENFQSTSNGAPAFQSLLSSEVDLVTLRFLIAYLQRFELNESNSSPTHPNTISPAITGASPHPSTLQVRRQISSNSRVDDNLSEEDLLRWLLSFRFGSQLFSPTQHHLRDAWSTSQWFAAAILTINHLSLATHDSHGICLEDEFVDDVRLLPSAFISSHIHSQRPQQTWLKADMGGINIHQSDDMRDYCIQAQFVPLVSTTTTDEEIVLHQLPSICCEQHQSKHSPLTSMTNGAPSISSASTARSTSLRLLTLTILSDRIDSLGQTLNDRTNNRNENMMDTTDHHQMSDEFEEKQSSNSHVRTALKMEDVSYAIRFYLHYVHILCLLSQAEQANHNDESSTSANETRLLLFNLVSTCWKQLGVLIPHLLNSVDAMATSHLLAYAQHLIQYFQSVFCVPANSGSSSQGRCEPSLLPGLSAFEASLFKVLLHLLTSPTSFELDGKRRLEFEGPSNSSPSNQIRTNSSIESTSTMDTICDHLITMIVQLLSWKVLAPVNSLSDLKRFLDKHMGMKHTVNNCAHFYRLAHLFSLGKSMSNTPNPNQDLMYYLAYLSEEFISRPPVGSSLALFNKDHLHYRALGFFLDLSQSIRRNLIVLDEHVEEARVQKIWEDLFASLNASVAKSVSQPLHRFNRLLKARCAYAGVLSGLTNSWSLVTHLSLDLGSADFVVRLFAATQVRTVLSIPEAEPIYATFEKKILTSLSEDKTTLAKSSGTESSDRRESLIMTLLACLAQMGLSMQQRERTILLHMCHLWRERPSARPLISLIYQQLSDCLQYHRSNTAAGLAPSSTAFQTAQMRLRSSSLFPPSSTTSLLDDHFDYVLDAWMVAGHPIADFPRELLMQSNATSESTNGGSVAPTSTPSLEAFLRQYAGRIIAVLTIHHDTMGDTIKMLLDAVGCDLFSLLKKHFSVACARFYAIYSQNSHDDPELTASFLDAATSCLNFFKTSMTDRKFNGYYHSKMNETLCAFIDLVVIDPSGPRLGAYTIANFVTSLNQLAKADKNDVPHYLCSPQHDRMQLLLLHLRVRIGSEFRAFRQWRLVEIARTLILDLTGEFISVPNIWRPIADLLLWMLPEFDARFPDHAHECVTMLAEVTTKLITQVTTSTPPPPPPPTDSRSRSSKTGDSDEATPLVSSHMPVSEMMLYVRHIITAMVEYSEATNTTAGVSSVEEKKVDDPKPGTAAAKIPLVSGLIIGLIRTLPPSLYPELTMLPPFPNHPLLAELNTFYQTIYRERNLIEEILCFLINLRSSSNPREGAAGLPHLFKQLRTHPNELNQLLQPIPPTLQSIGMEILTLPSATGATTRRTASQAGLKSTSVRNPIISVDGRNPMIGSASDSVDVVSDINNSIRVSNRILSSPDHETSGHYGFDVIAPLIGALCAFCSWSQTEVEPQPGKFIRGQLTSQRIRMLAVKCLGEIGAVDPYALNGHNSRVFRNANPLPPIASSQSITQDGIHPFAAALLASSTSTSPAASAAQLHASWYGRWYAVGGGLQASSCTHREMKSEPQAFANDPHHLLIVYLLNQHWRSNNVHVAQMAYFTLSNLFCNMENTDPTQPPTSQAQMVAAIGKLDSLTQAYLNPFVSAKFRPFRPILKLRAKGEDSESDAWEFNCRSIDDWICKLIRFLLLKRVRDPVLIHCAALASHLPEFATRLLPYVVYDILQQGEEAVTQMMALRINSLITNILAPITRTTNNPTSPSASSTNPGSTSPVVSSSSISALKLVLSGLQYVREQCLIIHRQPMPLITSKHQQAIQRAGMTIVQSIEMHFHGRLDLIKLAQAAQSCNMYATSLIYLEQWHVRTYQRLNSTSAESEAQFKESLAAIKQTRPLSIPAASNVSNTTTGTNEQTQPDESDIYHRLLLEVYRHVPDASDDIYGALHSRELFDDISSDLIISEHEGKFDTAMQIYDAIFQQAHQDLAIPTSATISPSLARATSSTDLTHLSPMVAHAGLVHSLQQLGCTHLVDRYMHDLSSTDPTAYGSISDVHYEAAWRTSNWDLQTHSLVQSFSPTSSTSGSEMNGPGLQTSLFHSLRALHGLSMQHKNISSFDASITQARARLVHELANANPETSQHVFPAIVHLQLLADMEKAWTIMDQTHSNQEAMDIDDSSIPTTRETSLPARFEQFERLGRDRLILLFNDFDMVEPILAIRGVILQLAKQPTILATHLRFVAALARQSNRRVVGAQAIRSGSANPNIPLLNKLSLKLEDAQLNWSEGLVDPAIRSAKHVIQAVQSIHTAAHQSDESNSSEMEAIVKLLTDSSCLAAEWMSKSHSEASTVIQRYLTQAASVINSTHSNEHFIAQQQHRCYYQLACFQDRIFQTLFSKSQSPEHEASRALFHSNEEKIKKLQESMQDPQVQLVLRTRDSTDEKIISARQIYTSKQMYIRRLEKEHAVDAQQNQQFDRSLALALEQAILNYALCLQKGDKFDTQVVYRLIALWFNHYSSAPYTAEKLHVVRQIDSIPSRKFVPLVYQIASRLSLTEASGISPEQKLFRTNIHDLIKRMILDHPYHALYPIFALAHGDQVSRVGQSVAGGVEMNQFRIRASQELLGELKKIASVKELVMAQEKLIVQYIALGGYKFNSRSVEALQTSTTPLGVLRPRDLSLVPVPTLTIPVRPDCNYQTSRSVDGSGMAPSSFDSPVVTIASFDPKIHLATSGVNVPLIIEMMCSDGKRHKQLLKSADDTRQDAVLEQFFKLVNELLSVHRATATRQLHIRTYNVVPLTPGCGLVEWVMNTTSLAECLVNDSIGAHSRYVRPGQKRTYRNALNYLRECHEARQPEEYTRRFMEVVQDFQPVFHRFFLEMFPAPAEWLARRTAYTRSVAVNSIVGFVVGLGDRHIHNILFDLHTAELIHIDLGVAFDMGIVLKTPEIVPFRLTRDMIDAMGVTGYEGGFRKSAEESMRVLRENREMLLTVLEVFLVDPLYKWALSPAKIQQLRPLTEDDEVAAGVAESEEKNREPANMDLTNEVGGPINGGAGGGVGSINSGAARAMFNVRQRLVGSQHKDQLSVEGQVNALIHEATDMERLAKMYYGWSAFV